MAVELWIDDGDPWYLSDDIWVVPGSDPNGSPGVPTAGSSAYVWARVHNRGSSSVTGATVRWYWADPSTTITRGSAHLIGTSYVDLAAGETKEVLCLTAWTPSWVNGGHECLFAEAFASSDPLASSDASSSFDVVGDRHVAQRNISVAEAAEGSAMTRMMFVVTNPARFHQEKVLVRARALPPEALKRIAPSLGLAKDLRQGPPARALIGHPRETKRESAFALPLRPGTQGLLELEVTLASADAPALVGVEQLVEDKVVGGLALLVRPAAGAKPSETRRKRG